MQNYKFLITKALTLSTITVVGLIISKTSSVNAASLFWNLELFDDSGALFGEGEFSYDPDTTETLSGENLEGVPFDITVNALLESVSISLLGERVISDPSGKWWELNSDNAMQQLQFTVDPFISIQSSFWTALSGFATPPLLTISGSSTTSTGEGVWDFIGTSPVASNSSLRGLRTSGTWTATLRDDPSNPTVPTTTPESSSIVTLLALGGLGAIAMSKKK